MSNCLRPSFEFVQFDELSDIYRRLTPNFSKSKKDITKLISVHDSIIILLSFGTFSFIFGHGWLHSNQFCKTCQKCFLSKLALFALHDGICGSFHNKDSFDMLYKNDC